MKTIYKYPLTHTETQILKLPVGAEILSVVNQYENCVLYALVDPTKLQKDLYTEVEILMVGTGHHREDLEGAEFISTVRMAEGHLMFHFFMR